MFKPKLGMMVKWKEQFLPKEEYGVIINIHKEQPYNGKVDVHFNGRDHVTEKLSVHYLIEVKNADAT